MFFRNIKILLTAGTILSGAILSAADISSDAMDADKPQIMNLDISGNNTEMTEALVLYFDVVSQGMRAKSLTDEQMEKLFTALDKDSNARDLIILIFAELSKSKKLDKYLDRFLSIAEKHPDSYILTSFVSSLLAPKREDDALRLLRASVNAFEDSDKNVRAKAVATCGADISEIFSRLSAILIRRDDFSGARDCLDIAFDEKRLAEDLRLVQAEMLLDSVSHLKASDSNFFLFFFLPTDKEKARKRLDASIQKFISAASEKYKKGEVIPVRLFKGAFTIMHEDGKDEAVRNILLSNLILAPNDINSLAHLADNYSESGDHMSAARTWRLIIKNAPRATGDMYLIYGNCLKQAGNISEAVKAYEYAMLMSPDNNNALYSLAALYYERGEYKKALLRLGKMKDSSSAFYLSAMCYDKLKMPKEALDSALKSLELAEKKGDRKMADKNFKLICATFAEKAKKLDVVESIVLPLIKADPNDSDSLNFLGYTYADWNINLKQAEDYVKRAVELSPDNYAVLDSMAWVCHRLGRNKEALEWIKKSLDAKTKDAKASKTPDPVILDHAGDISKALGDTAGAVRYWQEALDNINDQLDPQKIEEKIKAVK